jgi:hypothetical protein
MLSCATPCRAITLTLAAGVLHHTLDVKRTAWVSSDVSVWCTTPAASVSVMARQGVAHDSMFELVHPLHSEVRPKRTATEARIAQLSELGTGFAQSCCSGAVTLTEGQRPAPISSHAAWMGVC